MNAATFAGNSAVAPGSLVTVRGSQLAATAMAADDGGSVTLAGASVKVNGEPAQVLYASPEQINFLMPEGTPLGAARITLENLGRASEPVTANVVEAAPAVSTLVQDGRATASAHSL